MHSILSMFKNLLYLGLLLGLTRALQGAPLQLSEEQGRYNHIPHLSSFEDPDGKISIDDIRNIDRAGSFIEHQDLK